METLEVFTGYKTLDIRPRWDYLRFLPADEQAAMREIAAERHRIHAEHDTSRPLSKDYELIGVVGEWVYEDITGIPMDRSIKPQGDGRVDFDTVVGSVDVKTAAQAFNLLREENKKHAKILVLAQFYLEPLGAMLVGWEYDSVLRNTAVKDFGYGIMNHFMPAGTLRAMDGHYLDLRVWGRVRDGLGVGAQVPERP